MKKKSLTYLLAICFVLPCAFLMTACAGGSAPDSSTLLGYEVYINGTKTNVFECDWGEDAITAEDVVIKSNWTNKSKNAPVSLSEFEIGVKWNNQYGEEQTTIPNFWTHSTGSTVNDFATDYNFTLTKNEFSVEFSVVVAPLVADNLRVRIFDGNEYKYSAEMVWGYNDRETDTSKHFRFDIENLDADYNLQEHIQWALIKKEDYDALQTKEEKKTFIESSQSFSTGQIYRETAPGIYYVFVNVPAFNNKYYGEYGDGYVYNYATLAIVPIDLEQVKAENRILQHDDFQNSNNFEYSKLDINSEITSIGDYYVDCSPYVYENGNWSMIQNTFNESIKVHAVQDNGEYKLVELKDHNSSLTEWVFVNADGTRGEDVDTSIFDIELVDYSAVSQYINSTSIVISVYYKANDISSQGVYINHSKVFKTEVKIRKYLNIVVPKVEVGVGGLVSAKYVTAPNTFEFTYGEKYQLTWADVLDSPEGIINNVIQNSSSNNFHLTDFDKTEYSTEPYYGYVVLNSQHFAWKLDGVNYTSEPLKITYYINKKAKVEEPIYKEGIVNKDYYLNPINVVYYPTANSYKLNNYITIGNVVNEDISFEIDWVNVYCYELADGDDSLTRDQLIETIRENGIKVGYEGSFASTKQNIVGKSFAIMYDIVDTANVQWNDGVDSPRLFKIQIVEA